MFILLGWWAIFDLVGIKIWTSVLELRFRECEIGLGCGGPRPRFAPPSDSVLTFVASRLLQSSITVEFSKKQPIHIHKNIYQILSLVMYSSLCSHYLMIGTVYIYIYIYIYIILVPRQRKNFWYYISNKFHSI